MLGRPSRRKALLRHIAAAVRRTISWEFWPQAKIVTVQPLKAIKDKLGVGNGPLAEVKRFIPPIGQGSHSLGGHSHAILTSGKEALLRTQEMSF